MLSPAHSNLGQCVAKMLMGPTKGKGGRGQGFILSPSHLQQRRNINRAGQCGSPAAA